MLPFSHFSKCFLLLLLLCASVAQAQTICPGPINGQFCTLPTSSSGGGGGGSLGGTFNPSDKTTTVTLSGSNLTATGSGSGEAQVRSTTSHSNGKWHVEFTVLASGGLGFGFAAADANHTFNGLATGPYLGEDAFSLALYTSGNVYLNGAHIYTVDGLTAGHITALEIDIPGKLIWFKDVTAAGNWNANGSANPATGVGGLDFSALTASPWFICFIAENSMGSATVAFSGFSLAPSVGFLAW